MKEATWEDYILYDSNYMAFWKRQNYADSKEISGWQGGREGGMNRWSTQDFWAVEVLRIILLQWKIDIIIHLPKPMQCITLRVNPNVNYGLWVIITCQYRFINCNKCTTQVWEAMCV